MQIREHHAITARELGQPYYFTRWFYCTHADCPTKLVMAERYKVLTDIGRRQLAERERLLEQAAAKRREVPIAPP
jgi:hypothetical protein